MHLKLFPFTKYHTAAEKKVSSSLRAWTYECAESGPSNPSSGRHLITFRQLWERLQPHQSCWYTTRGHVTPTSQEQKRASVWLHSHAQSNVSLQTRLPVHHTCHAYVEPPVTTRYEPTRLTFVAYSHTSNSLTVSWVDAFCIFPGSVSGKTFLFFHIYSSSLLFHRKFVG